MRLEAGLGGGDGDVVMGGEQVEMVYKGEKNRSDRFLIIKLPFFAEWCVLFVKFRQLYFY